MWLFWWLNEFRNTLLIYFLHTAKTHYPMRSVLLKLQLPSVIGIPLTDNDAICTQCFILITPNLCTIHPCFCYELNMHLQANKQTESKK
jgi:hypothetical protein